MAEPQPQAPVKTPWFWLAMALALGVLGAAIWWWLQGNEVAPDARQAQLAAAQDRARALTADLAASAPATPAECAPGEQRQAIPGTATPPAVAGSAAPPPPTAGNAKALGESALAQHLENATALVIVPQDNKTGVGTGFFIAPNLLVTNRHVVEGQQRVFLTSSALKTVRRATVLHTTSNAEIGSPDFALLRMEEGTAPGLLYAAEDISKLASVVAAGFPAVVMRGDERFKRLMSGDASAAPDLSLTQGTVQSLQTGAGGMPMIVHTAAIAQGNSGGPLVDACGRVVGVNTFISVDQSQSARIQYAIRSQAMHAFLKSAGAQAPTDTRPCTRG